MTLWKDTKHFYKAPCRVRVGRVMYPLNHSLYCDHNIVVTEFHRVHGKKYTADSQLFSSYTVKHLNIKHYSKADIGILLLMIQWLLSVES